MKKSLRTEHLVFRHFTVSDAERLVALLNDLEISRWIGPMPHPYTIADAHSYLTAVQSSERPVYALDKDGELVGAIAIGAMLGFWLARAEWGQGLMTEAASRLISDHFASGEDLLVSGYHDGNIASKRVHEKLGFASNGTSTVFSQALQREVERHDLLLTRDAWEGRQ